MFLPPFKYPSPLLLFLSFMDCNIIQWNANGIISKSDELKLLIDKFKPIAICIQETLISPPTKIPIKNYKKFRYDLVSNNYPIGGVTILAHQSLHSEYLPLRTNLHAIAIILKSHFFSFPLTICNIYSPPSQSLCHLDMLNIVKQLPKPYLITGDFNAHNPMWGGNKLCPKGKEIEKFLNLSLTSTILNNGDPTHLSFAYKTYSSIDLSFVSNTISSKFNWQVHDDPCQSNHFPIIISLNKSDTILPQNQNYISDIWIYKRADWCSFQNNITFHNDIDLSNLTTLNIDSVLKQTCENILNAAQISIPKYTRSKRPVVWFCNEIKTLINKRKKALKLFRKYGNLEDFIEYKKYRALSRKTIKLKKKESWEKFVNSINVPINSHSMFQQIKRIQGKNIHKPITCLKNGSNIILSPHEIANELGHHFSTNISNLNSSPEFIHHKNLLENSPINYNDNESTEPYNSPFNINELHKAFLKTKSTAVGTDKVSYQMLNHLPNPALEFLLKIYNLIWTNHIYPNEWSKTIVIPIQKKDKDPHSTSSYRPICLINCICKIFEKMVNFRLTFILEKYKLLSPFQSGCRWNKSTIDNILHLENEVTHAFRLKRYTLAVILDIKSAYDSTWRRRILQKLNDWNIGSHLLRYIEFFLNNNTLQVNVNSKCLSSPFTVNNGIRQGSALSCALFNIALSDIPNSLPVNIKCNLYMDDLIIFYSQSNLSTLHNCIQHSLNNLNKWSLSSGFTFSPEKTVCMLFHRLSQSYHPPLFLGNTPLQYKESHKWLGMILDPKMNWTHHIEYLKAKMNQSINILKMLNNPNWGLSRSSLLRLYHIYCRPISDYGAIVYNSAKPNIKNKLNPIHNHVIRMITGAFRSSPLNSIHAESGIPNLEYRSAILINNYTSKIMSLPDHLMYPHISQALQIDPTLFGKKPKPIFVRANDLNIFRNININHTITKTFNLHSIEPWLITFCFDKLIIGKKENTSTTEIKSAFNSYAHNLTNFTPCFVDGSKSSNNTGCAFKIGIVEKSFKLNPLTSILSAELIAIIECLKYIISIHYSDSSFHHKYVIYSDSLSSLKHLHSIFLQKPIIAHIHNLLETCSSKNIDIKFCWIPSHKGIQGNDRVDILAKESITADILPTINSHDIKTHYKKSLHNTWNNKWKNLPSPNKLREIKDNVFQWDSSNL
ncbi:uncharacterized protein LOC108254458 [Diaphorina citri]|uniref:Uncharacterized protein LOC108254458 n=1 Tax=Diaphorina citri TaxID=121845 RepID=A0A1S4ERY4_DIACI|nr:uncharacterized protein LOC108254458 [Diaphorina citri]